MLVTKDDDMDPNCAVELRLLRAEIAALHEHVTRVAAVPRGPGEWPPGSREPFEALWPDTAPGPAAAKWLPTIHDKHQVLPQQHHKLMRWLNSGVHAGGGLWRHHPRVRAGSQLTAGERAADVMRNAFGSWTFVGGFLTFMGIWMIVNTVLLGHSGWDKYPYILLNLCLSMMAGLQGALILIAAKRADRVSAEQAVAHYAETSKLDTLQTLNNEMTERIEQATALLSEIHRHVSALSPRAGNFVPDGEGTEGKSSVE